MSFCYDFPRPALTVDGIILCRIEGILRILLIERLNEPYANCWALPGGFVDENETAEQAIVREIEEETSLRGLTFQQLFTVSELNRDPRGRTVSIIYSTIADTCLHEAKAADDAKSLEWFDIRKLPPLAFDHDKIIRDAIVRLDPLQNRMS